MQVRSADAAEIDHLARLWYDSGHEAHAPLVPPRRWPACAPSRAFVSDCRPHSRTSTSPVRWVRPSAFCVLKGAELYQLFVSPEAGGSGAAAALIADAEARLTEPGVETAWLACASATIAPRASTRSAADSRPARSSIRRRRRASHFRWKCGATKTAQPLEVSIFDRLTAWYLSECGGRCVAVCIRTNPQPACAEAPSKPEVFGFNWRRCVCSEPAEIRARSLPDRTGLEGPEG
jgi:hypothetical protein